MILKHCEEGLKKNFASLIFLLMILSLVLTEAGEDPNDKGPDLISHLNLIRAMVVREKVDSFP